MRFFRWAMALLLVVLLGGCDQQKQRPEEVLADYVDKWQVGDYSGMYRLLSARAQEACPEDVFTARHRKISQGIGLTGVALADVVDQDGVLFYRLDFSTTTVGDFSFEYQLEATQQDESWRLSWDHCHIFPQLNRARVVRVSRKLPERGAILDRNLIPLAYTGIVYEVGLAPGKENPETVKALAILLDKPEAMLAELISESAGESYVPVATLDSEKWGELRQKVTGLAGVLARAKAGRIYNCPACLAQTVGYVGGIQESQLQDLAPLGYEAGDVVGRSGMELLWERELAGTPGFVIDIRDESDNVLAVVAERPAYPGTDLVTTLDLEKVKTLDLVLGERTGCGLLLDFQGDIIAVASKPGFDPNTIVKGLSDSQYEGILALDSPFLNRAFNGLYPPGSVFKPFTALIALEEKVFDPAASWDTPLQWQGDPSWGGYRVTRVLRPHGPVNLEEAMRWSDNVYFADLGLKIGWSAFTACSQRLGFEQPQPFPLCYEQSSIGGEEGEVLLADSSYGQGKIVATPLHIALMYAALGRGDGILPLPRLTKEEPGPWLESRFSKDNIALIDQVLAYAASDREQSWAATKVLRGKTGTSEISATRQVVWYLCYFDETVLAITIEGDQTLSSADAVQAARDCLAKGIGN